LNRANNQKLTMKSFSSLLVCSHSYHFDKETKYLSCFGATKAAFTNVDAAHERVNYNQQSTESYHTLVQVTLWQ